MFSIKGFFRLPKKYQLIIVLLSLVPLVSLASETNTSLFPDLHTNHFSYVPVKYFIEQKTISGYPDGFFRPDQAIKRAEALKMLSLAIPYQKYTTENLIQEGLSTPNSQIKPYSPENMCYFPDAKNTEWYFDFICQAYQRKILTGYPDQSIKPENIINRAEALKIIFLHANIPLKPIEEGKNLFQDTDPASWYYPYLQTAHQYSIIIPNRDNQMLPSAYLTRGEFTLLLYRTIKSLEEKSTFGKATFYADQFNGRRTASGEIFYNHLETAAHRTLPLNTIVKVTNLANNKSIQVRINDRGPYITGHQIDLSQKAFSALAPLSNGIISVEETPLPQ